MANDKALGNAQDVDIPQRKESQEQYMGSYEFLKHIPAGAYEVDNNGFFYIVMKKLHTFLDTILQKY